MKRKLLIESCKNTCAWCGAFISAETILFPCFGRLKAELPVRGIFAWAVPKAAAKPVLTFITASDSEAKANGYDLGMLCCSEDCRAKVIEAIGSGFDLHDIDEHTVIGFGDPNLPDNKKAGG